MIYFDASALIAIVTARPNAAELEVFLESHPGRPMVTSTVGLIEAVRNCSRIGDFPNLMTQLLHDYDELALTAEVRDRAADLPGGLKTLDAIHVATAEMLGDELVAFVTYDRRMANVARSQGLPVESP
ncbi:type II toxin-antitoxin system VapC family toxin [Mycobacterium kyorinense]|uniref:PIN domain-containing protein n=1 Tax=Mycobacterium kyorinense TaxID=487514 RepID=A0A1X1Y6V8_9MYCO|nr:type II toxin-antitoxin system VapC family toxin [Mycobacterium kyorinense]ORW06847.1 PIN domain-containing protein [Mycobacterium kyorinense]